MGPGRLDRGDPGVPHAVGRHTGVIVVVEVAHEALVARLEVPALALGDDVVVGLQQVALGQDLRHGEAVRDGSDAQVEIVIRHAEARRIDVRIDVDLEDRPREASPIQRTDLDGRVVDRHHVGRGPADAQRGLHIGEIGSRLRVEDTERVGDQLTAIHVVAVVLGTLLLLTAAFDQVAAVQQPCPAGDRHVSRLVVVAGVRIQVGHRDRLAVVHVDRAVAARSGAAADRDRRGPGATITAGTIRSGPASGRDRLDIAAGARDRRLSGDGGRVDRCRVVHGNRDRVVAGSTALVHLDRRIDAAGIEAEAADMSTPVEIPTVRILAQIPERTAVGVHRHAGVVTPAVAGTPTSRPVHIVAQTGTLQCFGLQGTGDVIDFTAGDPDLGVRAPARLGVPDGDAAVAVHRDVRVVAELVGASIGAAGLLLFEDGARSRNVHLDPVDTAFRVPTVEVTGHVARGPQFSAAVLRVEPLGGAAVVQVAARTPEFRRVRRHAPEALFRDRAVDHGIVRERVAPAPDAAVPASVVGDEVVRRTRRRPSTGGETVELDRLGREEQRAKTGLGDGERGSVVQVGLVQGEEPDVTETTGVEEHVARDVDGVQSDAHVREIDPGLGRAGVRPEREAIPGTGRVVGRRGGDAEIAVRAAGLL